MLCRSKYRQSVGNKNLLIAVAGGPIPFGHHSLRSGAMFPKARQHHKNQRLIDAGMIVRLAEFASKEILGESYAKAATAIPTNREMVDGPR